MGKDPGFGHFELKYPPPKNVVNFVEIEGTICEGFANGNGSYCRVLAVSKGRRGGSIFDTPFETRHVKASGAEK